MSKLSEASFEKETISAMDMFIEFNNDKHILLLKTFVSDNKQKVSAFVVDKANAQQLDWNNDMGQPDSETDAFEFLQTHYKSKKGNKAEAQKLIEKDMNKKESQTLTENDIDNYLEVAGFFGPNKEEIENAKKALRLFKFDKNSESCFTGKKVTNRDDQIIQKIHFWMKYDEKLYERYDEKKETLRKAKEGTTHAFNRMLECNATLRQNLTEPTVLLATEQQKHQKLQKEFDDFLIELKRKAP